MDCSARTDCSARMDCSFRMCLRIVLTALIVLLSTACGGRNLYKKAKLKAPPFERGYAYNTRDGILDAGVEPVDYGGATVNQEVIYLASESRGIEALYRHGFQRKWVFPVKNGVSGELLLEKEVLYFGANDGNVYALDAQLGKLIWSYAAKTPILAKPTVSNHRLYVEAIS